MAKRQTAAAEKEVTETKTPKKRAKSQPIPGELVIGLFDPGMTPMLRAGLGGLAASLRALMLTRNSKTPWPSEITVGQDGTAIVEASKITLRWGNQGPEAFLKALFGAAFQLTDPHGFIALPGTFRENTPPPPEVICELQKALKLTFLQHGQTTTKRGTLSPFNWEIDGKTYTVNAQGYDWYSHQEDGYKLVFEALESGVASPAGWAYPGAVQRHVAHASSKMEYNPAQTLCAMFTLVGCVSYRAPLIRGGVLLIPEPSDLIAFALNRGLLTPKTVQDVSVAAASEAALRAQIAMRVSGTQNKNKWIASTRAVSLHAVAWQTQQKSRVGIVELGLVPEETLDLYDTVSKSLQTELRLSLNVTGGGKGKKKKAEEKPSNNTTMDEGGYFTVVSALKSFLCDNIARGLPWYTGFATATVGNDPPKRIHQYRDANNLGALRFVEKEGLIKMTEKLDEAEKTLVCAVHTALRQRFGAIAEESDNDTTRKNRFRGERERWRLAFSGAKTHEQIRAALADMWSRGGSNKQLKEGWEAVLVLLRAEHWQTARDLALVALASYTGSKEEDTEEDVSEDEESPSEPTDEQPKTTKKKKS